MPCCQECTIISSLQFNCKLWSVRLVFFINIWPTWCKVSQKLLITVDMCDVHVFCLIIMVFIRLWVLQGDFLVLSVACVCFTKSAFILLQLVRDGIITGNYCFGDIFVTQFNIYPTLIYQACFHLLGRILKNGPERSSLKALMWTYFFFVRCLYLGHIYCCPSHPRHLTKFILHMFTKVLVKCLFIVWF